METQEIKEQSTINTVNSSIPEKKREIVSVQVTPEEKRIITRMAVKDCGISVSEFVRTKIFMEPKTGLLEDKNENPILDEERLIYEDKISDLNTELKKVKDDFLKYKISITKPVQDDLVATPQKEFVENGLNIALESTTKSLFDGIKKFRDDEFNNLSDDEKLNFLPFEKYLALLLIRGLRRSYYAGVLNSNTGLTTDNIKEMAEAEGFNYYDVI